MLKDISVTVITEQNSKNADKAQGQNSGTNIKDNKANVKNSNVVFPLFLKNLLID